MTNLHNNETNFAEAREAVKGLDERKVNARIGFAMDLAHIANNAFGCGIAIENPETHEITHQPEDALVFDGATDLAAELIGRGTTGALRLEREAELVRKININIMRNNIARAEARLASDEAKLASDEAIADANVPVAA